MLLRKVLSLSQLGALPLPLKDLHLKLDQQNQMLKRLNQIHTDRFQVSKKIVEWIKDSCVVNGILAIITVINTINLKLYVGWDQAIS